MKKFLMVFLAGLLMPSGQVQAGSLSIRLVNLNRNNSGIELNFDDVKLDAVPAP